MRSGIVAHLRRRITRVRCTVAAAPLVEEHDPVAARVEEPHQSRIGSRSRAAVHDSCRLAGWVAVCGPAHAVAITDVEHALGVRQRLWMKNLGHAALLRQTYWMLVVARAPVRPCYLSAPCGPGAMCLHT